MIFGFCEAFRTGTIYLPTLVKLGIRLVTFTFAIMPAITIQDLTRGHTCCCRPIDISFDSDIYLCDFMYFGEGCLLEGLNRLKLTRVYKNRYKSIVAIALCVDDSKLTQFDFVTSVAGVTGSQLCMKSQEFDAEKREGIINRWDQCYAAGEVVSISGEELVLLDQGENSLLCINPSVGAVEYDVYRTNCGYLIDYEGFFKKTEQEYKDYHRRNNRALAFLYRLIGRIIYRKYI